MALTTILSEFILVRIFMAVNTRGISDATEFLKPRPVDRFHLMTLDAINTFMFPGQLKAGIIVAESRSCFKRFRAVTIEA